MTWCFTHPWMTFFLLTLSILSLTLASLFRSFALTKRPLPPEEQKTGSGGNIFLDMPQEEENARKAESWRKTQDENRAY